MYTIKIPNYLLWALDLSYVTALLRTTSTLKYFCFTPWFHPSWEGGWWGGYVVEGWGHRIFKQKLKLHDTSIKRIDFRIYFRDIWKMYLLVVEKISFSIAICHKCLEHSVVFPADLFWNNWHHLFPPIPFNWNSWVWSFYSSIL